VRRLSIAALVGSLAVLGVPGSAPADVGVRLTTVSVPERGAIRGWGTAGMPLLLVPEASAPRLFRCRGNGLCSPRSSRLPGSPYVLLGVSKRSFALRLPAQVRPGRYQVVLWCRACGGSLILAGATMYGQVVTVRPRSDVVRLVPLAPKRLAHCRRAAVLAQVCPRLVPRVRAPFLSLLRTDLLGSRPLALFNLERGGERPGHPERNRPPAMAHLLVARGHVRGLAPIWQQGAWRGLLADGVMTKRREHLLRFGVRRWGGRTGWLELAPSYLRGGMLGNHLIFRWGPRGDERIVSLHAWEPLTESADTLRRIVESASRR
jgi:hypothetical protein